ncbi:uncharacterized protein LOC100908262 [Galendromus occidentalis]|uniref:Uncharacterized protein LOC100908262 n=1 Tax=Galendromus occidentalis TaxID=34638 RepID=A0AAJ6QQW8_9ACAR|nr:uncharacterized protein LOC100908262 [Galendromus occidentalis]
MVEQAKKRPDDIELRQKDSDMEDGLEEDMQLEIDQQRKTSRKPQPRKRIRTTSQTNSVIEAESDSASVDSVKAECTAIQLMEIVEEALKGDVKSLERLMDENLCSESTIEEVVEALEGDEALKLYNLIFYSRDLPKHLSVYGQTRWLRYLLAEKEGALSMTTENKKILEPLIDHRQAIADQCLKLRGKLDLLLESFMCE